MIDEFCENFTTPSIDKSTKKFLRKKISRIIANFKSKNCIIAGVYYPSTLGFTRSTLNAI